jgi:predicted transcriptional regulator of viral defense system
MNIDFLHETGLIALDKQEQGLVWLIENGPLVENPPLPDWMLKQLVQDERILRLQRDLYLAPTSIGYLPSLSWTISTLNPEGYITGHAALSLRGLNDQDIIDWQVLAAVRRSDFNYGIFHVHFIFSPSQALNGERESLEIGRDQISVASVAQAFVDELRFAGQELNWIETARILQSALRSHKTSTSQFEELLLINPSAALIRRIGFLLTTLGEHPSEKLLVISRGDHHTTVDSNGLYLDSLWRLKLPFSPQEIRRAIHEF